MRLECGWGCVMVLYNGRGHVVKKKVVKNGGETRLLGVCLSLCLNAISGTALPKHIPTWVYKE